MRRPETTYGVTFRNRKGQVVLLSNLTREKVDEFCDKYELEGFQFTKSGIVYQLGKKRKEGAG